MYRALLTSLLVFIGIVSLNAQNFQSEKQLCDTCDKELYLHIESTSFIKNNEYYTEFTKGFTGIGFFLRPTLDYYLSKKTKVNFGLHLTKYSGINKFSEAIPIFSVQHSLGKDFDLVFGSIYSTLNHNLEEPLFRFDRYYQNNVEYGIQFLLNKKNFESDTWLNWEKYIFNNDPEQEIIQAGSVNKVKFNLGSFHIDIPIHLLVFHTGGQIDTSGNPSFSIFNGMTGLNLRYQINQKNEIGISSLLFAYQGALPSKGIYAQPFKTGNGTYLKLTYKNSFINTSIGYWQGHQFIAPKGEPLFMSISDYNSKFSQANRQLLTAKISTQKRLGESICLDLRAETYFDLMNQNLAYSYSLFLIVNESFFITKAKPVKENTLL